MTGLLLDIGRVREALGAGRVTWSRHGVVPVQERGITRAHMLDGLRDAQVIENYPDARPTRVRWFSASRAIGQCTSWWRWTRAPRKRIMVYEPSPDEFEPDCRTRRAP